MGEIERRVLAAGTQESDVTVEEDPVAVAAFRARLAADRIVAAQMIAQEPWLPDPLRELVEGLIHLAGTVAGSHNDIVGAGLGEADVVMSEARIQANVEAVEISDHDIGDPVSRDPLVEGLLAHATITAAPLRLARTPRDFLRTSWEAVTASTFVARRLALLAEEREAADAPEAAGAAEQHSAAEEPS